MFNPSLHQESQVLFRDIVKNCLALAFGALELRKLEIHLLEIIRLEQTNQLRLALLTRERNVDRFNRATASKVRDQVDLFNDSRGAFDELELRTLCLCLLKELDPCLDSNGVDTGHVLATDNQLGGRHTNQLVEIGVFPRSTPRVSPESHFLLVL